MQTLSPANGSRQVPMDRPRIPTTDCPSCQGAGYHYDHPNGDGSGPRCERCHGQGVVEQSRPRLHAGEARRLSCELAGADGTLRSHEIAHVHAVCGDDVICRQLRRVPCPCDPRDEIDGVCEACAGTGECLDFVLLTFDREELRRASSPWSGERRGFWAEEVQS